MKRQWKRTLSIILSVAMLFSMTGMNTVFALEGGELELLWCEEDAHNG